MSPNDSHLAVKVQLTHICVIILNRFDAVEILVDVEKQETMFCIVLGIFSLTEYEANGKYKCRHERLRTSLADTFIVGAQLEKINCAAEGSFKYNMLPYSVYKYRTRKRTKEPFIDAFSIENIQRPACLFEFYRQSGGATTSSQNIEDYLPARFALFDYPFCDRSLWNSSLDTTQRPYATALSEEEEVSFMLYHDQQLNTFRKIQREAEGIPISNSDTENDDDEDIDASSSSDDGGDGGDDFL